MRRGEGTILSIGKRIRERRKLLNLTQEDLAKKCGFASSQIVSQLEKGERDIKAWELARIADLLKVDFQYFFQRENPLRLSPILWRKEPGQDVKQKEAEFIQVCERYYQVEKLCGEEPECKLPRRLIDWAKFNFPEAYSLANEISRLLDLGSRPSSSLTEVLEKRFGVKIIYQDLGKSGSAASTWGYFGPAILMNSREAPWRRNFNFAHELFHLITWSDDLNDIKFSNEPLFRRIEQLAEYFASVLLLPAEAIELELNKMTKKLTYMDVVNIARDFDVSTSALLWRLVSLGHITRESAEKALADEYFKQLDKSTMSEKWWHYPYSLPERFVRLAFQAYQKGNLSRMLLAEYLNTSLIDLEETLAEYGLKEEEEAVYETPIDIA